MFYPQNHMFLKKNDSIAIGTKFEDFFGMQHALVPHLRKNSINDQIVEFQKMSKIGKIKKILIRKNLVSY